MCISLYQEQEQQPQEQEKTTGQYSLQQMPVLSGMAPFGLGYTGTLSPLGCITIDAQQAAAGQIDPKTGQVLEKVSYRRRLDVPGTYMYYCTSARFCVTAYMHENVSSLPCTMRV